MNSHLFAIFMIIILYFSAVAYSGVAVLRLFGKISSLWHIGGFWSFWLVMALAPFAVIRGKSYLLDNGLAWLLPAGHYPLAFIYYFALLLLILNPLSFFIKKFIVMGEILKDPCYLTYFALSLTFLLLFYGTYNAQKTPVVRHYEVSIPKSMKERDVLRAVLVADVHLGFVVDNERLEKMIEMINTLNPDIVFLAGDIIEDGPKFFAEKNLAETFRKLKPELGVYAVLGNHEYISGPADENAKLLAQAGISVIRDDYVKVENSFYIVGRDDISLKRFSGQDRLELVDIMKNIDHSLPIILLDHQPSRPDEAREQKADLMLSGHTHRGQFFPNNLITGIVFENDWGHLKKEGMHSIVTSGFGTWGPPIRVGTYPEIVSININFTN